MGQISVLLISCSPMYFLLIKAYEVFQKSAICLNIILVNLYFLRFCEEIMDFA